MTTHLDEVDLVGNEQQPAVRSGPPPTECLGVSNVTYSSDSNSTRNGSITGCTVAPVYYSAGGSAQIINQQVVVKKVDGSRVIITPERQYERPPERQLKEKDLKFLKIFSIIAIILFPPTGVAAFVYSRKTKKAFEEGLMKGDMDNAQKRAKTCERLIILSLVCGLLMYVLIFAVVEKSTLDADHWYAGHSFHSMGSRAP